MKGEWIIILLIVGAIILWNISATKGQAQPDPTTTTPAGRRTGSAGYIVPE